MKYTIPVLSQPDTASSLPLENQLKNKPKTYLTEFLLDKYLWLVIFLIAVISMLYYSPDIPSIKFLSLQDYFGLTRRAFERSLFLIPIFIASFRFGFRAGLVCSLISGIVMTPRILASPWRNDAIIETIVIVAIGIWIAWLIHRLKRAMASSESMVSQLQESNDRLQNLISEKEKAQEIIQQQAREILEVSTPVLRVWENVVVAPLIGTFDSQRAQQLTEKLLESIVNNQASVAIIDITGVPVIDTQTAQYLIDTINAARLLGAQIILTGVRPSIAKTVVHLGINLNNIITGSSLSSGLIKAMEILGVRSSIVKD